ncbi:MAG TPA: hypothetical protein VKF84_10505 [Candidatus Sulfotelmatobacter sp.]|nr:hypothetical protein [Candidatus Sulfotelmatobacter sp.]
MQSSYFKKFESERNWFYSVAVLLGLVLSFGSVTQSHAQGLGWEGETGIFVTPLAYTASSETEKYHPVLAYHYLNAGSVIGNFHEASIELGIGKRFEIGYTHEFHAQGDQPLSYLWQNGFEIFNGKFIVLPENSFKKNWLPAISAGFIVRNGVRNVGDYQGTATAMAPNTSGHTNGDIYGVGSKLIKNKFVPVLLTAGVRGTDAELWGMAGNAPDWKARAFGSAAFVLKMPYKSTLIVAAEAAQQPHHPSGFDGANGTIPLHIPTTMAYAARFIPSAKYKLNVDIGVAQIAGQAWGSGSSGVDLKARHQVGVQVSYGF